MRRRSRTPAKVFEVPLSETSTGELRRFWNIQRKEGHLLPMTAAVTKDGRAPAQPLRHFEIRTDRSRGVNRVALYV